MKLSHILLDLGAAKNEDPMLQARMHHYDLKFRKPAKVAVVKQAMSSNRSVRAICEKKFSDFEHGLGIISQRTGKREFIIDKFYDLFFEEHHIEYLFLNLVCMLESHEPYTKKDTRKINPHNTIFYNLSWTTFTIA